MRTILKIDDDIAAALESLARNSDESLETVVNDVLRSGLTTCEKPVGDPRPFQVDSARRGFLPGIDPLKLNELVEELEVADFARRRHGGSG